MPVVNTGRYDINYIEEGEGFPVLLIHGLAGDHTAWMPQLAAWKDKYRVIAFDNHHLRQERVPLVRQWEHCSA